MAWKEVASALALLAASACTTSTGVSPIRDELANARTEWSAAQIRNYRLELSEDRNYWSRGCQWNVVITDGIVAESSVDPTSTSSNCRELEVTVEQLHDRISSWADTVDQFSDPAFGEHTLDVTFGDHGVPTTLIYDLANGDDEEALLQVSFASLP